MGLPLDVCQQRVSHREYLTRMAWREEQMNCPSRTDYYLMQVSAQLDEIRAAVQAQVGAKCGRLNPNRFKIKFTESPVQENLSRKTVSDVSKSVWAARVGVSRKRKSRGRNA